MDLAGKYLVLWLSPEAIETFLGVLEPAQERAMTTWTVAGQVVGKAGSGVWIWIKCVLMPDGRERELRLLEESIYFLRWELLTTARLCDALPYDVLRSGEPRNAEHARTLVRGSAVHEYPPRLSTETVDNGVHTGANSVELRRGMACSSSLHLKGRLLSASIILTA